MVRKSPAAAVDDRLTKNSGSALTTIALLLAGLYANPAMAQDTDPEEVAGTEAAAEPMLDEIIVTAQKRAQNLQDVPLSIIAMTGDQLAASGITNTHDLKTAFPGVNIRTTTATFQPSIRGVGTSSINVENPVALYIDGVYYPSQRDAAREFEDVSQIAVLKGPQGTLFGRNATGGVIQITTKAPSFDFHGHVDASIDNYAKFRGAAYVTGGLTENLAASLSASHITQGDGWGRNATTGRDIYKIDHILTVRGKLSLEAGASTNLLLIADYMDRSDNLGPYFRPFPGTGAGRPNYIPIEGVHNNTGEFDARNTFEGGGVSLTVEHDFDFGTLTSISAYREHDFGYRFDADLTPALVIAIDSSAQHGESATQEIQLTSRSGAKINWAVGGFYFYSRNSLDPIRRLFGPPIASLPTSVVEQRISGEETTNSFAPFAQVDFEILPKTRLTLGGRWTYEKREYSGSFSGIRMNGEFVPAVIPPVENAITAKKPTWRVALDHQVTPDILAYASYNRGFKSGGFNIGNPANPPYQPEKLDAFEVGSKIEIASAGIRLNSSLFYYDYSNIQVLQFINNTNNIVNGAKAKLYGLDVDAQWQVTSGLRFSGGFSILHSEFVSYPNAAVSTPLPNGGVVTTTGDVSGNRLPLAQKFSASLAIDYVTDLSFGELALNATMSHSGKYFFEADNFTFQKSYETINLNASVKMMNNLRLSVFVKNLLDNDVISFSSASPGIGYITAYDNPPRTFGVSARVEF